MHIFLGLIVCKLAYCHSIIYRKCEAAKIKSCKKVSNIITIIKGKPFLKEPSVEIFTWETERYVTMTIINKFFNKWSKLIGDGNKY